jgi:eukaryotic-like serine/threonine-protein kinase
VEQFGARHGLVGDTDRLIGVVAAALGRPEQARDALDSSVAITLAGYGPAHTHTLRAELSQARLLAAVGDTRGVQRLTEISNVTGSDAELNKTRWLAQAYLAETRCMQDAVKARNDLDAIVHDMQATMPEGGSVLREVRAIRAACG